MQREHFMAWPTKHCVECGSVFKTITARSRCHGPWCRHIDEMVQKGNLAFVATLRQLQAAEGQRFLDRDNERRRRSAIYRNKSKVRFPYSLNHKIGYGETPLTLLDLTPDPAAPDPATLIEERETMAQFYGIIKEARRRRASRHDLREALRNAGFAPNVKTA